MQQEQQQEILKQDSAPMYWFDYYFDNMDPFSHKPNPTPSANLRKILSSKQIKTDISETETELRISCEVPGWKKSDLKIEIDDEHRLLTISGESKIEKKEEKETYHMVERSVGKISRNFTLPTFVSTEQVKAILEDGVLQLVLAKVATPAPKKVIQIE